MIELTKFNRIYLLAADERTKKFWSDFGFTIKNVFSLETEQKHVIFITCFLSQTGIFLIELYDIIFLHLLHLLHLPISQNN